MGFSFPTREVTEGAARLLVPDVPRRKGPGTAGPWPFYNPTMAVNRDLSAIVLARWPHPLRSVLDGLAATGAWGIRMAREARVSGMNWNDRSTEATDLIRETVRRNGVDGEVHHGDLRDLLASVAFDFVDIDPFGPPAPFLAAAFTAGGVRTGLGITATDTAVLCGTYPEACGKRYGAQPLRCAQGHEIGLRILLAYGARLAAEAGTGIRPMFAYAAEHFLRVFVAIDGRMEPLIGKVRREGPGVFVPTDADDPDGIGPLWTGPLVDSGFIGTLTPSEWSLPTTARLLDTIQREAELPPFFVTTDELAAAERGSPPKIDAFLDGLRSVGYRAARTHLHPRGVKTDAPSADVLSVFRERMPSESRDGSRPAS